MSAHVIKVPDIGEGIAEVELVAWHVKPGDSVAEDQVLADVMTDKATVEIPSPVAGTVLRLGGEVGQMLAVGAELIGIDTGAGGAAGAIRRAEEASVLAPALAPAPAPSPAAQSPVPAPSVAPPSAAVPPVAATREAAAHEASPVQAAEVVPAAGSRTDAAAAARIAAMPPPPAAAKAETSASPARRPMVSAGARAIASPAVRARAWELGIDLAAVPAGGPGGRVMQADLDRWLTSGGARSPAAGRGAAPTSAGAHPPPPAPAYAAAPAIAGDGTHTEKLVGLRRKIAQKMQESKRRIPHYSYVEEVDVGEVEALRATLNARWGDARGRLTLLPFLVRAIVLAVRDVPQVNARFDDDAGIVTKHDAVHAGIATQTDAGLLVPVLRDAQSKDLWTTAREIARLADAARGGRIVRDELSGSTITVTSLGKLGGIVTTPVINHPEVAIVGVNKIATRPIWQDGGVVGRPMMNLSSSFDHRVVDGMDAARFVQRLRELLEHPATLFLE
jgi:2-oxoisovalerate dehydrogenase E2 component (dihydrolipoyl transacylase)